MDAETKRQIDFIKKEVGEVFPKSEQGRRNIEDKEPVIEAKQFIETVTPLSDTRLRQRIVDQVPGGIMSRERQQEEQYKIENNIAG